MCFGSWSGAFLGASRDVQRRSKGVFCDFSLELNARFKNLPFYEDVLNEITTFGSMGHPQDTQHDGLRGPGIVRSKLFLVLLIAEDKSCVLDCGLGPLLGPSRSPQRRS